MTPAHPLTLTVEQTAEVLGVSRSTAYELVRNGAIVSLRLRRRIVVPTQALAEKLAVSREEIWATLAPRSRPDGPKAQAPAGGRRRPQRASQAALFTMDDRQG